VNLKAREHYLNIEVELLAVAGRISDGRRLRLEITPIKGLGAMPGFERAYDETYHHGAVNHVFTGGTHTSSVTIPIVPPKPSHPL
jgi:predicted acyl esterase